MKNIKKITVGIVASLIVIFGLYIWFSNSKKEENKTESEHIAWSYEGKTGPNYWGELSEDYILASTGTEQSPINIITSDTVKGNDDFKVHFVASKFEIEDTGHSVEFLLDETEESNNYVIFNGSTYNLIQIHFHNQSENEIDGIKYPLEAHFVSKNDKGKLLVISVMLETGVENIAISDNFSKISQTTELNPMDIISDESNYYTFKGSLTTPPCTEDVTWVVLKDTTTLSKEQLDEFKKHYTNNFRPVQPINSRVVTSN